MGVVTCILALGSVGDVLPLAHLAIKLSDDDIKVCIASHVHHQTWLVPLIEPAGVAFHALSLPPARVWNTTCQGTPDTPQAEKHLEACISICERVLGLKVNVPGQSPMTHLKQQRLGTHRLLVHNLFALEGFHIAEALGVLSVVVSACLPYPPPASFKARLKAAYPRLWGTLQHEGEGVRWAEVEHWMWPLFTERWGEWRRQRLHLPAVPYQAASQLPPAPPLLLCLSPRLVDQPASWPSSVKVCGSCKPSVHCASPGSGEQSSDMEASRKVQEDSRAAAAPNAMEQAKGTLEGAFGGDIMDSFSGKAASGSAVISNTTSSECGPLAQNSEATDVGAMPSMRPDECRYASDSGCEQHLKKNESPLVCIDFGSMGSMGLLGNAKHLVKVLALALRQSGLCGVLLTGHWDALSSASQELSENGGSSVLAAVRGFVDHAQLFSHCCALVHHGGAGTVAAALRAGQPSVICPLQFDQFMWADKLEHMGLARVLPGRNLLNPSVEAAAAKLSAALSAVVQSDVMRSTCQQLRRDIEAEDGAEVAANYIRRALHAPQHNPGSEVRQPDSPVGLVRLPNGWEVHASSASEAHFLYQEIFVEHCYLQHGITVQEADVVVDVGANIGLFSLYLLSKDKGERPAQIWALEPLPPNISRLHKNMAAFGAKGQVTIVPVALGSSAAKVPFTYYPRMPGNSTSRPAEKAALQAGCMHASLFEHSSTHACQVTTLDDFMRQQALTHIDLLKVDVEGDEEDVLLGLSQFDKVAQIVVEVHNVDGRVDRVREFLESQDFLVAVDGGFAPNTAMIYAAREDRLLAVMEEA